MPCGEPKQCYDCEYRLNQSQYIPMWTPDPKRTNNFGQDSLSIIQESPALLPVWNKGEPNEAMWCLVFIPSNDSGGWVQQLWFNPDSIDKWWFGSFLYCYDVKAVPWAGGKPTHWMKMPEGPGSDTVNRDSI